jgi:3-oxoacyl-[acyl-carrier-protein] synthase-3
VTTIGLQAIEYYLPTSELDNPELSNRLGLDQDFLDKKVGIKKRLWAAPDQAASDLAIEAAKRLFAANRQIDPDDLGLLIVCTQSPDYQLPNTACLVQDALGIPTNVAAWDINLGCSGFVYSLAVASAFMERIGVENGLIITCDLYSKIMDSTDRGTVPLFSDAAAAVWLKADGGWIPRGFVFGTDGAGFDNLILEAGGSRHPLRDQNHTANQYLHMNGREIFNFMMRRVPASVEECLEKSKVAFEEVEYFVFHQASRYLLESLGKKMGIDRSKLIISMQDIGNTTSSTVPIAIKQLLKRDPEVKRLVISGFGVGLSWATALLERRG